MPKSNPYDSLTTVYGSINTFTGNLHFSTLILQYSGIWFNIEMVPNEYVDITKCSMTNYTWEGDLMMVEERGFNDVEMKIRKGSSMFPTEGQPGVLTVNAEGVPNAPYVVRGSYCDLECQNRV